ncbi:MAG: hypothetical protein ACK53V_10230, partial [Planctomycetota bacterium]
MSALQHVEYDLESFHAIFVTDQSQDVTVLRANAATRPDEAEDEGHIRRCVVKEVSIDGWAVLGSGLSLSESSNR